VSRASGGRAEPPSVCRVHAFIGAGWRRPASDVNRYASPRILTLAMAADRDSRAVNMWLGFQSRPLARRSSSAGGGERRIVKGALGSLRWGRSALLWSIRPSRHSQPRTNTPRKIVKMVSKVGLSIIAISPSEAQSSPRKGRAIGGSWPPCYAVLVARGAVRG
jgi:hypothetical protein